MTSVSQVGITRNIPFTGDRAELMEALKNGNTTAMKVAGYLKEQRAIPFVLELIGNSESCSEIPIVFFSRLGEDAIEPLLEIMKHGSEDERANAITAMSYTGIAGLKHLLEALKDPGMKVRVHALDGLGWFGITNDEIITGLRYCLNDKEILVVHAAVRIVGSLYVRELTSDLLLLLDHPSPTVRHEVYRVLSGLGAEEASPVLLSRISRIGREELESLVYALCDTSNMTVFPQLLRMYEELDESMFSEVGEPSSIKDNLSFAIVHLGGDVVPSLVRELHRYASEGNAAWTRNYALMKGIASMLGEIGTPAQEALLILLGSHNATLREMACLGLEKIEGEQATRYLVTTCIEDVEEHVRKAAFQALKERPGEEVLPFLQKMELVKEGSVPKEAINLMLAMAHNLESWWHVDYFIGTPDLIRSLVDVLVRQDQMRKIMDKRWEEFESITL